MSLEDRFRKLKKDQDESIRRWEQAEKDKIRDAQKTIKSLSPGVTRVCNSFCAAMKWDLNIRKSGEAKYFDLSRGSCSFRLVVYKGGVDVVGICSSESGKRNWRDQTTISSEDFTEDELGQLLERWYRAHMLI